MNKQAKQGLSVINLSCERNERLLFKNLNMSIELGQLVQIKGDNGSGKTSLLKLLTGLVPIAINSGKIYWRNQPIQQCREQYHQHLCYIGHQCGVKKALTVYENMRMFCVLTCKDPSITIQQALEQMELADYASQLAANLSEGQIRRVALAKLLLLNKPLWILDEPFTAIDKTGVNFLQRIMIEHAEQGGMIIFTSHQSVTIAGHAIMEVQL